MLLDALMGYTHERSTPSAPTVTKLVPFAFAVMPVTAPVWAAWAPAGLPSAVQNATLPSDVPAAMVVPVGQRVSAVTAAVAPTNSRVNTPVPTAESFTLLSAPPVKALLPSAERKRLVIPSA